MGFLLPKVPLKCCCGGNYFVVGFILPGNRSNT